MSEKQTCPRRMGEFGPWKREENLDKWKQRDGLKTCSFCGSISPDNLFNLIEDGAKICPTDKPYKAYIKGAKCYFQHLSIDEQQRFIDKLNVNEIKFELPGYFYVTPFFMRYLND